MKLPDSGSLHSRRDLQRTFAFSDSRHVGEVSMPDFRLQRRSDPILALQKKGRVRFAPETVRCVIKLQSQVHHASLQLRRHFLFTERGEFSALRFNQRRRSGGTAPVRRRPLPSVDTCPPHSPSGSEIRSFLGMSAGLKGETGYYGCLKAPAELMGQVSSICCRYGFRCFEQAAQIRSERGWWQSGTRFCMPDSLCGWPHLPVRPHQWRRPWRCIPPD